jgi:hypothetical protein
MSTIGHQTDLLDLTSKTTFMLYQTAILIDGLELIHRKPDVDDPSFYKCTNHTDRIEICPECDHKEDPITYETIGTHNGVCMDGLCYDLQTVSALVTKKNPFTQRLLTWEEQTYIDSRMAERSTDASVPLVSSAYIVDFIRMVKSGTMTPGKALVLSVVIFDTTFRSDPGNVWRLCTAYVVTRAIFYMTSAAFLNSLTRIGIPDERSVLRTLQWAYMKGLIPRSEWKRLFEDAMMEISYPENEERFPTIVEEMAAHDIEIRSNPPYSYLPTR